MSKKYILFVILCRYLQRFNYLITPDGVAGAGLLIACACSNYTWLACLQLSSHCLAILQFVMLLLIDLIVHHCYKMLSLQNTFIHADKIAVKCIMYKYT